MSSGLDNKLSQRVKRHPNGAFTIETQPEQARDVNLCDCCGRAALCAVGRLAAAPSFVQIRTRWCEKFIPLVAFRPPLIGMETTFNTMRLGRAWTERLSTGTTVALYDSVADNIFGYARTRQVFAGGYNAILLAHAKFNHCALHDKPEDPVAHVDAVLRKAYGAFMNKEDLQLQALYLTPYEDGPEPIHDAEIQR